MTAERGQDQKGKQPQGRGTAEDGVTRPTPKSIENRPIACRPDALAVPVWLCGTGSFAEPGRGGTHGQKTHRSP